MRAFRRLSILLTLATAVPGPSALDGQALGPARSGPVIEGFGPVYDVPDPDWPAPTDQVYRIAFEVATTSEAPDQVNPNIETLARFLNMHARVGVPLENMHLALVIHGAAGKDVLDDRTYRERFGFANPYGELLARLKAAGVRIYLCGQTAMARGLPPDRLAEPVDLALSAMTALYLLQEEGYRLNAW